VEQLAHGNQRWLEGQPSFRPPSEPIRTRDYDVALIADDTTVKRFVLEHHYEGSYPSARVRIGLYRHGELVGVAVFSTPGQPLVLTNVFPTLPTAALAELGRFVLLDEVPGNGETWFLGQAFRLLRERGYLGIVSFSDPVARPSPTGEIVFPGHIGTIYQAHNAVYLGRSTPQTKRLFPDGRIYSQRAKSKARNGESGAGYASAILERYGAPAAPDDPEARRAWVAEWVPKLTRPFRHRGCYRYAWTLNRRYRHLLATPDAASQPYPKTTVRR
jgi:hypothetical protein